MATKPNEKTDESAPDLGAQRYRVLIAGISRPGGAPAYQGEIVMGSELGDAKRIQKLLELKRIEVVGD